MTCTSFTDKVKVKVPSFQEVTLFFNIKFLTETLLIYGFVCLNMLLTTMI